MSWRHDQVNYPTAPLPLDVPWTGKVGGNYYDRKYFVAESAEDYLGNRFSLGEPVLYCISAGRGQMMAVGKVLAIRFWWKQPHDYFQHKTDPDKFQWRMWEGVNPDEYELTHPEPVAEVEVQIQTAFTSGHWDNEKRSRPAWVNPMNVTAVVPEMVAAFAKKVTDADS